MGKNKNVVKILEEPPRVDITMDEVLSALKHLGFEVKNVHGSHYKFEFPGIDDVTIPIIPRPHSGNKSIKRPYIRKIQEAIYSINERKKIL